MPNTYDLVGKSALVTGGAKGIGRSIVARLVASGAKVRVWDLDPLDIDGVTSDVVDVTQGPHITSALSRFAEQSTIDILVNDAGYLGSAGPYLSHPALEWQRILATNLIGTMQVTQAVLPYMIRSGGGRIVNMGSLAGKEGVPTLAAYSAASAGIIAFTKALSREIVGHNVFVNCVAPGPIDTGMIQDLGPQAVASMIADSPMRRLGLPEEVAHLVTWLCTEASRYNTGAIFDMSGGRARY